LQLRPLLDGVRGRPAADIDAFCEAAARFSEMAAGLGDVLAEVDVNPVIVHEDGAVAVDALVAGRDRSNG
ncbi:MAG: acetate--CoA ligase family protein, partial [Gammaproteobacteria bacterium]|nr:acetate--CoA ligase family protein [Gammaproteobacteria bacterium]